ncbi:subclass B1 metallo-beta-lactamase [Aquimarina sp. M1]
MREKKNVLLNILNLNLYNTIRQKIKLVIIFVLACCLGSCKKTPIPESITISEDLQLIKLNDHSYIHISYITLKSGAKFPCNGFVAVNNKQAFIFDSPATNQVTTELINWLQDKQEININGVVFSHYHDECTKGIAIFKRNNILTIASKTTKNLMVLNGIPEPDQVFDTSLELQLDNYTIINSFLGEAHSKDNIVTYFPEEKLLFGGCMIESLQTKKGNLADANLSEWSKTATLIKKTYPAITVVIPGLSPYGNQNLLDYTISLFKTEN